MTKLVTFIKTNSQNIDFRELVSFLDADLAIRDGDEHAFYAQFNKTTAIKNVIVAYINEKPVAVGSFKKYHTNVAEIKRMFVLPEFRGMGIALRIITLLENWAAESGFSKCILETGKKQPEAIQLYQKAGYQIIENYGQYQNVENSVCMEKAIKN